jgi:hypothetical protein
MLLGQQGVEVMADDLSKEYELIVARLLSGTVVPVLGAGANLGYRPPDIEYERGGRYLPSGSELAEVLAKFGLYPRADVLDVLDLARVSQYAVARLDEGPLNAELHDVFAADYRPTRLHSFLVRLARHTREAKAARGECMLFMTTNYDDALEQAFRDEGEPYDLVTYINNDINNDGRNRGHFRHISFEGKSSVIRVANKYMGIPLDRRTVIIKIHGAVDRLNVEDSFVITEDDYIDYITRADIAKLFPMRLVKKIMKSHFLFLGYSLRDWNFRVMLYRLRREGARQQSWAIEANPDPADRVTWPVRRVGILPVRVETFVAEIEQRIPALGMPG